MKKLILIVILFSVNSLLESCNSKGNATSKVNKKNIEKAKTRDLKIKKGAASAVFDKKTHNFGTVKEGQVVKAVFKIKNSGKTNLRIIDAQATCGCTVPTWPKKPIKPGETEDIKVEFKTAGKKNRQQKTVTLITNSEVGIEVLTLRGFVIPKSKK